MEKNENGFIREGRGTKKTEPEADMRLNCRGESNGAGESSFECSARQLAMVYTPYQCFRMLYSIDEALRHGTLFEELYKPLEECP